MFIHIYESGLRPWTWLICRALCWLGWRRWSCALRAGAIGLSFLLVEVGCVVVFVLVTVVCFQLQDMEKRIELEKRGRQADEVSCNEKRWTRRE